MAKYVIKRVAYGVVTLFVLVSLTFFMQQLLPGDPFVGEKNLPEATMRPCTPNMAWTNLCGCSISFTWQRAPRRPGHLPAERPSRNHGDRGELCSLL